MRALIAVTLLALSGCSWDPLVASIFVEVDGIPQTADHLDVTLSSSDTSVTPKVFRPSFQPAAIPSGSLHLSFTPPSPTGTFTVAIVAADRSCPSPCASGLAGGTTAPTVEPATGATVNLQVTLH